MPATSSSERRAPARPGIRRYVAFGDSFTAGAKGAEAAGRWPDALAAQLRAVEPSLEHRNLAVAGARSAAVAREQLEVGLSHRPDLVTLVCGANDVLHSVRPDVEGYAATLSAMFGALRSELPDAIVLTATTPNLAPLLGLHERSRRRVAAGILRLNEATRWVARRHEVRCLELAAHPAADERRNFAADGYHPSEEGNRRAAEAFGAAVEASLEDRIADVDPKEIP